MNKRIKDYNTLMKWAFFLSIGTIGYNIIEGVVSVFFGMTDETLALFGFGVDSFVEVMSGIGIAHMIVRMQKGTVEQHDSFERRALYITAVSFFLLTAGLVIGSAINIAAKSRPDTTIAGIIISNISIATMWFLYRTKLAVGTRLNSEPIIADANCTKSCFYLSFVLLLSSILYMIFKVPYIDAAGSLAISWFTLSEGRETLEKARSRNITCTCDNNGCCQ